MFKRQKVLRGTGDTHPEITVSFMSIVGSITLGRASISRIEVLSARSNMIKAGIYKSQMNIPVEYGILVKVD
jgi:hypothetical protein